MAPPSVDHASILAELKGVRRAGLVRLRGRPLPALEAVAASVPARTRDQAVEALLRLAVSQLDAGTLRTAAEYTLGLAQGTSDWPPSSRRSRAAEVYRVSVERFRKHHEVMVLEQVAERIVRLAAEGVPAAAGAGDEWDGATHRSVEVSAGDRNARLMVHVHPVDLLRDVDVVVSPTNTYLALPELYKSSVSASLRRAGTVRGVTGDVLDDPVHHELRKWTARHGTSGRPVLPGTVAATGSGALAGQGVRRIYHAAVAVPRAGTNDYDVLPADVTRAHPAFLGANSRKDQAGWCRCHIPLPYDHGDGRVGGRLSGAHGDLARPGRLCARRGRTAAHAAGAARARAGHGSDRAP
ncbi:hypothetical protein [Streptomyces sp. NPDC058964]|uniref:hypothetical protein n=1 Tax=Streptomyces sp. NPDC058964 TaxID=3346681 RepID=UPI0036BE6E00